MVWELARNQASVESFMQTMAELIYVEEGTFIKYMMSTPQNIVFMNASL